MQAAGRQQALNDTDVFGTHLCPREGPVSAPHWVSHVRARGIPLQSLDFCKKTIEAPKESTIAQEIWFLTINSGTQLGLERNVVFVPLGSLKVTGANVGAALVTGSRPVRGSKLTAKMLLVLVVATQATESLSFASTGDAQPKLFHTPLPREEHQG
jgi:hypothetical protein